MTKKYEDYVQIEDIDLETVHNLKIVTIEKEPLLEFINCMAYLMVFESVPKESSLGWRTFDENGQEIFISEAIEGEEASDLKDFTNRAYVHGLMGNTNTINNILDMCSLKVISEGEV